MFSPFYSYHWQTNYQADLIDFAALKRSNSFYTYLLVIIDIFSRKLWVMPLKPKSAASMVEPLRHWLDEQLAEDRGRGGSATCTPTRARS